MVSNKRLAIIGCIGVCCMIFISALSLITTILPQEDYVNLLETQIVDLSKAVSELRNSIHDSYFVNHDPKLLFDLDDLYTGPRVTPVDTSKSLVVMAIGKSDKAGVDKLITTYFNSEEYTFLLFHYDNSTYHEFEWYSKPNTIAVRVLHKMKFWYLKRFLLPNMAAAFSYIIILDADIDFTEDFSPQSLQRIATSYNLALVQPSHKPNVSYTYHATLFTEDGNHLGRYSQFIECGPAVWISSEAYQCLYNLLQVDLTSGWGLDILWGNYMIDYCAFGEQSIAVLDAFQLLHTSPSSQGTASSTPKFNRNAKKELSISLLFFFSFFFFFFFLL